MPELVQHENAESILYSDKFLLYDPPSWINNEEGVWDEQIKGDIHLGNLKYTRNSAVNQEISMYSLCCTLNENTYTQYDLLNIEDEQVDSLIFEIRKNYFINNRDIIAYNLQYLYAAVKEEDSIDSGIDIGSLRNFYNFLQLFNNIKIPTISLSPDNNIYASWRNENRLFSIHFFPNYEIHFIIFKPNDMHPKQKIRLSGTATIDTLKQIIMPEDLNDWILD